MRTVVSLVLAALAVVAAGASPARASSSDFAAFVHDLAKDPKAAEARLASCDLMVLPSGRVRRPCKLSIDDLTGGDSSVRLELGKVTMHAFARSTYNWQEAEVVAKSAGKVVATYHVVEVGSTENERGDFVVLASQWSRMIEDSDALSRAKDGTLKEPSPIADTVSAPPARMSDQEKADRELAVEEVKTALSARDMAGLMGGWLEDGATMFGSAPKQTLTGKSGAKTFKSWKLEMAPHGGIAAGGEATISWGATQVYATSTATAKAGDDPAPTIRYVAFVVWTRHMTGGGSLAGECAMMQFAVPQ